MDEQKREKIASIKTEANKPKELLMNMLYKLEEAGAIADANKIRKIIISLEIWQNK